MKLTSQQWLGVIAVLIVVNLTVFGSLIWLLVADPGSVRPGPMGVDFPASPATVARAAPTLRPTFTPTPGAAQPSPTETPVPTAAIVPSSTPAPADAATTTEALTSTLLPTDTPTPTDTAAPTDTPMPVPTDTPTPTSTPTPTYTPTDTSTPVPTQTSTPPHTPTPTPTPAATPTTTLTPTPVPSKVEGPAPTATATPTPRPTVAPVAGVKVLAASDDRIDLSWKPAPGPASLTYHIYWDMGLGLGLYTYKTSVEGTRYSDLNLRPGTVYRYRIVAYDGERESPACEVLATTRTWPERVARATSGPTPTPRPSPTPQPTATLTLAASFTPTPSRTLIPSPTRRPTAAPASTPTPRTSPTPRRFVATPTPLPPDTVLLGLMSSHEYEDDLGFITIVGEVRNDLQMNVGKVVVTATFYNISGQVIGEASTSTMIDILLPGQRSPFALTLPGPVDPWEYSLRITARPTLEQPLAGLEVVQSQADEDEVGFYHVTGGVKNAGQRTADRVQVIVTLYDKWGKIVNAGFVYSEPRRVRPGEKAAFDCSFNYYPLVVKHVIQVERD